jgi:hypothetical protein
MAAKTEQTWIGWRKKRQPKCGAYARNTGKPCQAPGLGRGGRCKLHGGKSTGPRTEAGKARSAQAARESMLRYWDRRRAEEPVR